MASNKSPGFEITDLSGGFNDYDSEWLVPDDQCVEGANMDFQASPLGCKRKGASTVNPTFLLL